MKVLLSIKPEFVDEIRKGEKKFEYRKRIFKNDKVNTVVLYATMPYGRVVGEFDILSIIEDTPEVLWEKTKENSGISEERFIEYFLGKNEGYAIEIKEYRDYPKPLKLHEVSECIKTPPQSFMYLP